MDVEAFSRLLYAVVRRTTYHHFCAGETLEEAARSLERNRDRGVRGILDHSVEDALDNESCDRKAQNVLRTIDTISQLVEDGVSHACVKRMALSARLAVARRCCALLSGPRSGAGIARSAAMAMSLYSRGGDADVAPCAELDTCHRPNAATADDLRSMSANRHCQIPADELADDSGIGRRHHDNRSSAAAAAAIASARLTNDDDVTNVWDRDPGRTITRGGEEDPAAAKQPSIRQKRVAIQIRSIICEEMERTALRDHLLGRCGFFVDGVRMSPDLRTAFITWTCHPQMAADAYRRVSSAASKLRSVVFQRLAMRFSPRLEFRYGGYGGSTQDEQELEEAFERLKREED
ncbi:hypothetical protein CBR_g41281 [Chara braunii]|uniref:Proline dehydrogenase n=1 Tax=Chara braunii TaxID=69332 RepID=A0A388LVC9_CHABU|nr:hypothetical protein CBR_g41281 [Chara braunii]|eukprot:GBG86287.1 hypothetical protein CBR_g41281 [Chara braunii]